MTEPTDAWPIAYFVAFVVWPTFVFLGIGVAEWLDRRREGNAND
jgi:hypothetical protein